MDSATLAYLKLLRNGLRDQVLPALNTPVAQQTAKISLGLFARILVQEKQAPPLRLQAMSECAAALSAGAQALADPALQERVTRMAARIEAEDLANLEELLSEVQVSLIDTNTPAARQLSAQLMAIETRLRRDIEAAYLQETALASAARTASDAPPLTEDQILNLRSFLVSRFPGETALRIASVKAVPGGFSKQTLFVELEGARTLPASIVVRRDGAFLPMGKPVSVEYPILSRLHEACVAVPRPLAVEASGQVLGTAFIVVTRIPGTIVGDLLDVRVRDRELGLDLARKLARMHSVPAEDFGAHVDGHDQMPMTRVRQEIEAERTAWRALRTPAMVVETALAWLLKHIHCAGTRRALVHRDIGMHNMLVDVSRISAFLDWECPAIGNPAEDLGYARPTVTQLVDWDDFLAAYAEAGGFRPSNEELDFYTLWGMTRVALIISRARAGVVGGQLEDLGLAYVGEHFVQRLLCRVSETLARLLPVQS